MYVPLYDDHLVYGPEEENIQRTQLDNISDNTHNYETDADGLRYLYEFASVRCL